MKERREYVDHKQSMWKAGTPYMAVQLKKAVLLAFAYCLRSQSPWCRGLLMAPVHVVQGTPGPSGAAPAPSGWILGGSWDGAELAGEALKPEQYHVSAEPDLAKPGQRR